MGPLDTAAREVYQVRIISMLASLGAGDEGDWSWRKSDERAVCRADVSEGDRIATWHGVRLGTEVEIS